MSISNMATARMIYSQEPDDIFLCTVPPNAITTISSETVVTKRQLLKGANAIWMCIQAVSLGTDTTILSAQLKPKIGPTDDEPGFVDSLVCQFDVSQFPAPLTAGLVLIAAAGSIPFVAREFALVLEIETTNAEEPGPSSFHIRVGWEGLDGSNVGQVFDETNYPPEA